MTTVVGVHCRDGVVIGTDSGVVFSHPHFPTVEQEARKLFTYGNIVVAGTGQVGFGQRFFALIKKAWDEKLFVLDSSPTPKKPNDSISIAKAISRAMIEDLGHTHCQPGQYGALVAFPFGQKTHLCEYPLRDFQPEFKDERVWWASLGSGQHITDPFLAFVRRAFWGEGQPTVQDGIFAVTWTIQHVIDCNPGGIRGPISIGVLERGKGGGGLTARELDEGEINRHRENVEAAIEHLGKYPLLLRGESVEAPPPSPPRPQEA